MSLYRPVARGLKSASQLPIAGLGRAASRGRPSNTEPSMSRPFQSVCLAVCLAVSLSCTGLAATEATLYDRIGGLPVLQRVSGQMLARVTADPSVNQPFRGVDIGRLSTRLAAHLCSLTGGGCVQSDDSMKVVHAGLEIDEHGFYAVVESLRLALDANGVGEREKNELLRLLAPMKRDIVTR